MPQIRFALLLCLVVLLPLSSTARGSPASGWYKVEIIAFEWLSGPPAGVGVEPADRPLSDWHDAVALRPSSSGQPVAFERLSQTYQSLGPQLWSLSRARSDARPLIHRAWFQPIGPAGRATAVHLRSSDSVESDETEPTASGRDTSGAARMEGTITLDRARFVHCHVDLLLRRPAAPGSVPALRVYRLRADRRLQMGELQYIDHAAMGLLIKLARVGPASRDEPPDSGSEPTGEN
jgi:hypothetical protein